MTNAASTPVWSIPAAELADNSSEYISGDRYVVNTPNEGGGQQTIVGYDVLTGKKITVDNGYPFTSPSFTATVADGILYMSQSTCVVARHIGDGTPLLKPDGNPWRYDAVTRPPIAAENGGVILVEREKTGTWKCTSLTPEGATLWSLKGFTPTSGDMVYAQETLYYVDAQADRLVAFDTRHNREQFRAADPDQDAHHGSMGTTRPVIAGDTVIAMGAHVVAFDRHSGAHLWTNMEIERNPQVDLLSDGTVLLKGDGKALVLDARTGDERARWTFPTTALVRAAGDLIFAIDGTTVSRLNTADGTIKPAYTLEKAAQSSCAGAGLLAIQLSDRKVVAFDAGSGKAARVDGKSGVVVTATNNALDMGNQPFSAELWVSTTTSGHLLHGYPADKTKGGFELILARDGRIRFAVGTGDLSSEADLSQSDPTRILDGRWHHVAVTRDGTAVHMYLDGVFLPVQSLQVRPTLEGPALVPGSATTRRLGEEYTPETPLALGAKINLGLGGRYDAAKKTWSNVVTARLREVRFWRVAIEGDAVRSRLHHSLRALDGQAYATHPDLRLNLHLDAATTTVDVKNDAYSRTDITCAKWPSNAVPADFVLTGSFPYRLEPSSPVWPAKEKWASRALKKPDGSAPVRTKDGTLSWVAGGVLVGVDVVTGLRLFSLEDVGPCSPPVTDGGRLYVACDHGVIAVTPRTGEWTVLRTLSSVRGGSATRLALSPDWLAVCDGKLLRVVAIDEGNTLVGEWKVAGFAGQLTLSGDRVVFGASSAALAAESEEDREVAATVRLYWIELPSRQLSLDTATSSVTSLVAWGDETVVMGVRTGTTGQLFVLKADGSIASPTNPTVQKIVPIQITVVPEESLIVVLDTTGTLHGLSRAKQNVVWSVTGLEMTSTKGALPALCVTAGRFVVVTLPVGVIYWIDSRVGALGPGAGGCNLQRTRLFLEFVPSTPVLVDSGCFYLGSGDSTDARMQGAMHCVVAGETLAYYNGRSSRGLWTEKTNAVQVVDVKDPDPLSDTWCVEAWFRTLHGGTILNVIPCSQSRYGLKLEVYQDTINCFFQTSAEHTSDSRKWKELSLRMSAPGILEGEWHHIAVSCDSTSQCKVTAYLDGAFAPSTNKLDEEAGPLKIDDEYSAYLGGLDAGDTGTAFAFVGMLAEVRLWSRALTSTRISERMHVGLTGEESGLVAWWNFTSGTPRDGARNHKYDGKVQGDEKRERSYFGLSELPYVQPNYPTLASQGRAETATSGARYTLELLAHTPEGVGLPGRRLKLWYVQNQISSSVPDRVQVTSAEATTPGAHLVKRLDPEMARLDDPRYCLELVTNGDGKVTLDIVSESAGHDPEFDVNADFMPGAGDLVHVLTVVNRPKTIPPAAGTLRVQAKLIQDYNWKPGLGMSSSLSKHTWRVTVTATSSDGSVRAGEPVQLWADAPLLVRCGTTTAQVDPHTRATFHASGAGEVALVFDADSVTPPHLYAWAGFMHPDDCVVIDASEDVQKQLANVDGKNLTTGRMTNWDPDASKVETSTLLTSPDSVPQAEQIASGVRTLMAAASPSGPESTLAAGDDSWRGTPRVGAPETRRRGDVVRQARTMRHLKRRQPIAADRFSESLTGTFPGAVGISFAYDELAPSGKKITVTGATELPAESSVYVPRIVGGPRWTSLWDAFKTAAEHAAAKIKTIIVGIANTVEAWVEYAGSLVKVALKSIREAVDVVVSFFDRIGVAIKDLVKYLSAIFNWGEILRTHAKLEETLTVLATEISAKLKQAQAEDWPGQVIANLRAQLPDWLNTDAIAAAPGTVKGAATSVESDDDGTLDSATHSEAANWLSRKAGETTSALDTIDQAGDEPEQPSDVIQKFVDRIKAIDPNDLLAFDGKAWAQLFQDLLQLALDTFEQLARSVFGLIVDATKELADAVEVPEDCGFLSDFYKWITQGKDMTIAGLAALLATPTCHFGWAVVGVFAGGTGKFADDFEWLPEKATSVIRRISLSPSEDALQVSTSKNEAVAKACNGLVSLLIATSGGLRALADYQAMNARVEVGYNPRGPRRLTYLFRTFQGVHTALGGTLTMIEQDAIDDSPSLSHPRSLDGAWGIATGTISTFGGLLRFVFRRYFPVKYVPQSEVYSLCILAAQVHYLRYVYQYYGSGLDSVEMTLKSAPNLYEWVFNMQAVPGKRITKVICAFTAISCASAAVIHGVRGPVPAARLPDPLRPQGLLVA